MAFTYTLLIILLIIAFILKHPSVKGFVGEKTVQLLLKKLDPNEYYLVNDLLIPGTKGKTTQIDHVVISAYGIFVIETKNYKGWITGTENSQYWTQTIYKKKARLFNPIWQNKGHVEALKALLSEFENIRYIPIVVFSGRATLKVSVSSTVIYTSQLVKNILSYKDPVLSKADREAIVRKLAVYNLQDKDARTKHAKTLQKENEIRNQRIKNNLCPSCGGELVERNGKYGKFIGCSNYPSCKFTLNNRA
ncbi:NERD domain-containing protein [Brevibacillus borstelensis]|uniref:NERD domain-containing protein n=1 Tax=Brevibacillus borstelensis TaxID=45462 RepID=UPI00203C83B4|nr:NERD domain-containing protein [Brevibacillus borstelensis]MCM3592065.1 NERD domain-containing protein [Brevibacillus borstelensis]MED1852924.1 NERD domain-containing protein [Brevibacillus borstelensis]MED1873728.1 NERD domain-containing protein [Brevibacillus borstelensis]